MIRTMQIKNQSVHTKAFLLLSFVLGFLVFSTPTLVFAKRTIDDAGGFLNKTVQPTGISTQDVSTRSGSIIQGALRLVGIAFLILMVYGGFIWMTARGEESQIDKAKETIVAAVIGMMIVVGAYALTNFITNRLIQGQVGGGGIGSGVENNPEAPIGCCEFKVNEEPTWTAFTMTKNACEARCVESLGEDCDSGDWKWDAAVDPAACEARRLAD